MHESLTKAADWWRSKPARISSRPRPASIETGRHARGRRDHPLTVIAESGLPIGFKVSGGVREPCRRRRGLSGAGGSRSSGEGLGHARELSASAPVRCCRSCWPPSRLHPARLITASPSAAHLAEEAVRPVGMTGRSRPARRRAASVSPSQSMRTRAQGLNMAGRLALAPQRLARARPIGNPAGERASRARHRGSSRRASDTSPVSWRWAIAGTRPDASKSTDWSSSRDSTDGVI